MDDVLIIIPTYNEEKNIENVVRDIRRNIEEANIMIINDCSSDRTETIIQQLDVSYISLPFNLGYSAALQTGFKYATKNLKYRYVVQFDGDGQHLANEIKKLYNTMVRENADIVIGSRFKEKGNYHQSFMRKIGSRILKYIIRIICGINIQDPTSGFQILNRKVFRGFSFMNHFPDYPDANVLIELLFEKYKIREIPVSMKMRENGVSMHSGIIAPIKYMVKMLFSIFFVILRYVSYRIFHYLAGLR